MGFLTPSVNRRWNEFIGLLWMALALLGGLSLTTFSPTDPSLNTATGAETVRNWVGVVGTYTADLLYQLFGACAFLFPLTLAALGWWRFRSRGVGNRSARVSGAALFLLSLMAALALIPYPIRLYDLFPLGGVVGILISDGLRRGLNGPGTAILLTITSLASLYLLTTFSVERASAWLQVRFGQQFQWLARLQQKWTAWKQARAARSQSKIPVRAPLLVRRWNSSRQSR